VKVRSQSKFYSTKDYYNYGTKNDSHVHEQIRKPTKEEKIKRERDFNSHNNDRLDKLLNQK